MYLEPTVPLYRGSPFKILGDVQFPDIQNDQRKSSQILGYSDKIDVIGRTNLDVEGIFLEIEKVASSYPNDLMVNGNKTK
uniref:Uncharacterized protein n=1 Tax=Megaselia scalaris TaxID=36166 RepID=T1GAM0_MEGSC